ncbi:DUF3237 domain-containing protein [Phenylobacterium sp.]|uniref:DUF3237 domain-containing protein n=1 Tax=Phenylobacterium sp. TaxID=1871053 RepID=UPI0025EA32AD|nr:DUF3237 domain-containing protein [Phenylobacterium sp.]
MIEELRWAPLFVMRLQVAYDRAQRIGAGPLGTRAIFPVDGGTFEGPRLKGRVLPDGADWVTWRSDGAMLIDVRTALETHDGAVIALTYQGLAVGRTPQATARFNSREGVAYADLYARTTPRFETSDPRYAWLNRVIAVANGSRDQDGPIYHVFEVL